MLLKTIHKRTTEKNKTKKYIQWNVNPPAALHIQRRRELIIGRGPMSGRGPRVPKVDSQNDQNTNKT